ncbi:RDD family protein [Lewinella sp. 4G2]|uniref:RDD family protein n=1 Tax=Lewinella sp. 4G2 TaxID=1803372 RepID=UPI0007B4ADDB|nr:RDD family protein [Lewinella sp. 4G2]OAV44813.1 hypothetical protein A3850_010070 [Lewinella sp. 4G2]
MLNDTLLDQGFSDTTPYENFPIASRGKRFLNYLIDYAGYTVLGLVIGVILGAIYPEILDTALFDENNQITDYLLGALLIIIYYPLTEGLLEGKSLGKMITKTRTVKRDGNPVSMEDIMIRTISRIVPFDPLSFLGKEPIIGWHDKWSKTIVIDESDKSRGTSNWD